MENTMAEQLYTIPVNDAFHADCECPLCQMQKTLEEHAIEYTMGPSYMEDDNRAMTDKMGFCSHHISMLYKEKNRLGLALMLKTHTDKTTRDLKALSEKENGFIKAYWCGNRSCEDKIKEEAGITSRCIPFDGDNHDGKCLVCGSPAKHLVYWGKQY